MCRTNHWPSKPNEAEASWLATVSGDTGGASGPRGIAVAALPAPNLQPSRATTDGAAPISAIMGARARSAGVDDAEPEMKINKAAEPIIYARTESYDRPPPIVSAAKLAAEPAK